MLCSADPKTSPQPPGPNCANTTCPSAANFELRSGGSWPTQITNVFNHGCMEGIIGPGRSSVDTNVQCSSSNVKQMWTLHADGTLRASNNRTDQCLTAELQAPAANTHASTVDVYVGELADGSAAVLFFNRGSLPAATSVAFTDFPGAGWMTRKAASVRNIWDKKEEPSVTAGVLSSGTLISHSVAFLRVTPL